MLTSTDFGARFEHITHNSRFQELRFPKDECWRQAYATLQQADVRGELSGLAFALAVNDRSCELRSTALALAAENDFIIHEFPYSEPIFGGTDNTREIYNSHNFEAGLISTVTFDPSDRAVAKVLRLEQNLVCRAARVLGTSAADLQSFRLVYGCSSEKLSLCPNGADSALLSTVTQLRENRVSGSEKVPNLLFTGSSHKPNVDAARYLIELALELPEYEITIAGGVSNALTDTPRPRNVHLIEEFGENTKLKLLSEADIFLNPVVHGSGTSLKAIEALGCGIPMVSTPEGARGLEIDNHVHATIVPRERFGSAINALLSNPEQRRRFEEFGRERVRERYTWSAIASRLADLFNAPLKVPNTERPFVCAFNDYPISDGMMGGAVRVRNLLEGLDSDVALVVFGREFKVSWIAPGISELQIPKTREHLRFEELVNEGQLVSANDIVATLFADESFLLKDIAAPLVLRAHVVVFEHCYMAQLIGWVRQMRPDVGIVYSAHNVESGLKHAILSEHPLLQELGGIVQLAEAQLSLAASLIVCCTDEDAGILGRGGTPTMVIQNGYTGSNRTVRRTTSRRNAEKRSKRKSRNTVGFVGSGHMPNIRAAQFICDHLAPLLPHIDFELVGDVCNAVTEVPENVRLLGVLPEPDLEQSLSEWALALNPVSEGSGSSLKIPLYLAHQIPTLSTSTGSRGFRLSEAGAGEIADLAEFSSRIQTLLSKPGRLTRMRAAARCFEQTLDWNTLTEPYRAFVRDQFKDYTVKPRPSLLVVTYRYTEPPLGGAESYLVNVVKEMRWRFGRIDLAAINVSDLSNWHHFGTILSVAEDGGSGRIGEIFDRQMFFPSDPIEEETVVTASSYLEALWQQEEGELAKRFAAGMGGFGEAGVLGGLYGIEVHDGAVRRWTAPEFSLVLPEGTRVLRLKGWSAEAKSLEIEWRPVGADSVVERTQHLVDHKFLLNVSTPTPHSSALVRCSVSPHFGKGDHRPLGLLLEEVAFLINRPSRETGSRGAVELDEQKLDFADDLLARVRQGRLREWMCSAVEIAQSRSTEAEQAFAMVRGPHSKELMDWAAGATPLYDVLLVQGIPFDVIPSTVAATISPRNRRPTRVVTLPHFHGDDRFYYWRRYLDAFKTADANLFFSDLVAKALPSAEKNVVVPGGGVHIHERNSAIDAAGTFDAIYSGPRPFFLLLGRKTASKGYEDAVNVWRELEGNRTFPPLVIIGPDEDRNSINVPGVHYLGLQRREVVCGALAQCLALINMSRSESFGIVICEAWLFSRPVIANRSCYSFRELIRDGATGILVSTGVELFHACQRIIDDPLAAQRMGEAGFREVLQRFTWHKVGDAFYEALHGPEQSRSNKEDSEAPSPISREAKRFLQSGGGVSTNLKSPGSGRRIKRGSRSRS